MVSFLSVLLSICLFVAVIAVGKWRELSRQQELKDLVAWSVVSGDGIPLWAEVSNAQIKLGIQKDYCIFGDDEWEFVKEILQEYRKNLTQSYFNGSLLIIKSKYAIHGEHYFMFSLYEFLSKHQCDYQFLGHDMHKEIISYKSYGESFSAGSDATYTLTDFAVVFHKMSYITYLFCKNSKIANPNGDAFCNEKSISNILESKQIKISRV